MKNYTSQVPVSRSISLIEAKLAAGGAKKIMKEISDDGKVESICFAIPINGLEMPFKLPAEIKECETILKARYKKLTETTLKNINAQAERTAWKLILDWVEIQLTMIELHQVEFMQVFMSYLYDYSKKQTYFEKMKERGFKKLLPAGEL